MLVRQLIGLLQRQYKWSAYLKPSQGASQRKPRNRPRNQVTSRATNRAIKNLGRLNMSELYLTLLGLVFIALAGWRNSVPAVLFGLLMFGHAIFLGDLAQSDPMTYLFTAGIASTLAMAGCYAFRRSLHDVIAFRMAAIAATCLLVNIIGIIFWLMESPMGGVQLYICRDSVGKHRRHRKRGQGWTGKRWKEPCGYSCS